IYDPDSVEVHDVMIAAEKSRFALTLTKTVADGLVRTFRELTQPR
ncbi:MAG TPA: flagellar hook-basal body complex protein FliE, partial [Leptospiraceae bacterium]|nr:flagellar hook-basal body complex protein FliE [Leptospiraceae bacterium]